MATKLLRDWEILTGDDMKAMVAATKQPSPGIRCYNLVNELGERKLAEIHVHRSHLPLLPGYSTKGPTSQHSQALPPHLREWLRPYQKDAVDFVKSRAGTILALDLGIGKTAIASASCGAAYTTVVCPASAIIVWETECKRMGWTYRVLDHKADRNTLREIASLGADVPQALIISYNLLPALAGSMVLGSQWQTHTLIADEAHQLTNKRTQWAEMFRMIHRERTILLTATPMRNRLRSLWGLLDCACYGAFGSEWEFRKHFCGATMGDYGLEDGDPTHQDELALRLTEVVLKRTRAQVQIPLPVHTRHVVEVPIPPRLIMGALTSLQKGNAETIRALGALRVAIGQAKAVDALVMLDDLVDAHGRVILWVWHHAVADILQEWKRPGVEVDVLLGDTNTKKRSRIIEEWRTGDPTKPRVLIASIGAAATAIALTTAKAAVFVELDWTPMNLIQAEKRHYRFGNVFPEISTTYLVAPTVGAERQMIAALLEKAEASELALDVDGSVDQMRALLAEEPPTEKSLVDRWLKEVRS